MASPEIYSHTINYDDMVAVGNTQRAIFDIQTEKYMMSPNSQDVYFRYHQQNSEQKCFFTAAMVEVHKI